MMQLCPERFLDHVAAAELPAGARSLACLCPQLDPQGLSIDL